MSSRRTSQLARMIDGVKTEIVIQRFADRILVLVTQLGKVGALIQATHPSAVPFIPSLTASGLPETPPSIQLTHLLGQAPTDHLASLQDLYVAQIASIIWTVDITSGVGASSCIGVVVGLALKVSKETQGIDDKERMRFTSIMAMLQEALLGTSQP